MCNFMFINFREDLQINLTRDITLPKGLRASLNSTVTTDHFHKVDQMLGGLGCFIYSCMKIVVRFCAGDLPGSKRTMQVQGNDFVSEEFKGIAPWKVLPSCLYHEVGHNSSFSVVL